MRFLEAFGLLIVGFIVIAVAIRGKRAVLAGILAGCLGIAIVGIGGYIMLSGTWKGINPLLWENWITLASAPVNQKTIPLSLPSSILSTPATAYRQITWMELVKFIEDDHTNWNRYDPVHYNCLDYAVDLVANAEKQNIKAWIVVVEFYDQSVGHAFVGFETSDRGVVFIEPQGDNTYTNPKVGQYLCDDWGVYACMGKIKSIEYMQCDHSRYCTSYTL